MARIVITEERGVIAIHTYIEWRDSPLVEAIAEKFADLIHDLSEKIEKPSDSDSV